MLQSTGLQKVKHDLATQQQLCKTVWYFFKKLTTELPYDPVIPLGIYLKKMKTLIIKKGYMHPNFHAALFTIVKIWKQPKCPPTDIQIKKMWHIYKTEYYSVTNKDEILPLATMWMNLEGIMLSKISHRKIDILLPLVQFKK